MSPESAPRVPRGWWLVPEVAVLVILATLLFAAPASPNDSAREVANLAARAIENEPPGDHHEHGHDVAAGDRMFCGVDVFGTDPPGARPAEVRTVYGYYFCAVGAPGVPYSQSARSDGPVVVIHLGVAPSVLIARSGAGYAERVRAMMPDQYEQWCFTGLRDDSVAAEVRRRYESAFGS